MVTYLIKGYLQISIKYLGQQQRQFPQCNMAIKGWINQAYITERKEVEEEVIIELQINNIPCSGYHGNGTKPIHLPR